MKPFFKWSGGKSKEIVHIMNYKPENYSSYYEPFLGGGAVWLYLKPNNSIVSDSYPDLITFFKVMKRTPNKLINKLNEIAQNYNKEVILCNTKQEQQLVADKYYYNYRAAKPKSELQKAIRFYILRQLSFSGMLRFDKNGNFNVPYGWYKSMKIINEDINIIKKLVKNTEFYNQNWSETIKTSTENDFVFLDPPYTRKFQKYHPNGNFSFKHHQELANWFASKQSKAMIIINKDDFTEKLYKPFIKFEYNKKYSIQFRDRMTEEDSNTVHILATNY